MIPLASTSPAPRRLAESLRATDRGVGDKRRADCRCVCRLVAHHIHHAGRRSGPQTNPVAFQSHGADRRYRPWHPPLECPIILCVRAVATPLACGSTVILKASELCPADALSDWRGRQGLNILSRCDWSGGVKSPAIMLDDADLDEAVAAIASGAYMYSGQMCLSTQQVNAQGNPPCASLTDCRLRGRPRWKPFLPVLEEEQLRGISTCGRRPRLPGVIVQVHVRVIFDMTTQGAVEVPKPI